MADWLLDSINNGIGLTALMLACAFAGYASGRIDTIRRIKKMKYINGKSGVYTYTPHNPEVKQ